MENWLSRNMPALREEECALLRSKSVLVAGCGGLGGFIAEYAARAGIGRICLCDPDVFTETNLNRQLGSSGAAYGQNKAEILGKRLSAIAPGVCTTVYASGFTREAVLQADLIFDGLDSFESRNELFSYCKERDIPFVHGAVKEFSAQIGVNVLPDGSDENAPSVLSFTAAFCAALQVCEGVKILTGRKSALLGKVLFADLLNNTFDIAEI